MMITLICQESARVENLRSVNRSTGAIAISFRFPLPQYNIKALILFENDKK